MTPSTTITVNSRWIRKQVAIEVEVTRITFRTVSFIALDKSFSGIATVAVPTGLRASDAAQE